MNTTRLCGCKGHRSCLECETHFKISTEDNLKNSNLRELFYCPFCNLCYPSKDVDLYKQHPKHLGEPVKFDGIYIKMDFLTEEEHDLLMSGIDSMPWDSSQSGRKKQNFGPKCNFKARKMRLGDFKGFPKFSKFVQEKFDDVPIMQGFQTIEQCSLDYDCNRGSSIDPHVDDCWVWGERIVTVNLLSDSVLTLTKNHKLTKYNLDLIKMPHEADILDAIIRVPMPKNSLIVMYGSARYNYEHRVLREDITERRVCLAYREFTPMFLEGGEHYEDGKLITDKARQFFNIVYDT